MRASLQEFLDDLPAKQYALIVGNNSVNPLRDAFAKKRVVHPGVRGQMVPPGDRQQLWQHLLAQPADYSKDRAVYFHIPFCLKMCLYCGFFQNYTDEERESLYIDNLIAELQAMQNKPYFTGAPIQTIYIGGGTPSALSPNNVGRLLTAIRQYVPLVNDYELTLEARVNDLVPEKIETWFAGGVNRLSVGVQTFNTRLRQMMGRIDEYQTIIDRLTKLADYRQAAIVIDLIYGLPGQSQSDLLDDLAVFDKLPIDGMDLYQLNLFDVSPLKKAIDAGSIPAAATTIQQTQLFAAAEQYLNDRAYIRKSNCHWAKTGRERNLYNQLSKCGAEIFPFGSGAGGNIGSYSLYLDRNLSKYIAGIQGGEKPMLFMSTQSPSQDLHNDILRQLEQGYFNLPLLVAKYGDSVQELECLLSIWEQQGLLTQGTILHRLTTAGRFWQMNIAQSLLECAEMLLEGNRQFIVEKVAEQG